MFCLQYLPLPPLMCFLWLRLGKVSMKYWERQHWLKKPDRLWTYSPSSQNSLQAASHSSIHTPIQQWQWRWPSACNLRFCVLFKDTLTCGQEEPGSKHQLSRQWVLPPETGKIIWMHDCVLQKDGRQIKLVLSELFIVEILDPLIILYAELTKGLLFCSRKHNLITGPVLW